MISFFLLLLLSLVLISCLIIKLIKIKLPRKIDIVICVVLPTLTLLMFIAMFIECNIRRNKDIKVLNELITIVEKTHNYNRVFVSNEEKKLYTDSLLYYKEQLNKIAAQDSLITIISGNSPNIKANINQAKEVIDAQLKHIIRLNNFIDTPFHIDSKQIVNNIHLQEPYTKNLQKLNFIFSCKNTPNTVVAIQATVIIEDTIVYSQQYEYNRINSITIPHVPEAKERVELGYITFENNKYNYKYIIYGE